MERFTVTGFSYNGDVLDIDHLHRLITDATALAAGGVDGLDPAVLAEVAVGARRLREVAEHLYETWFSWIGGHESGDVFYYRIQSPVVIAELDHHCGVFLDYDIPKHFHIHTVLRTPHGNDYGRAWVRHCQQRNA